MKQAFYILTFVLLTGCTSETFNKTPCAYDFTTLHDSLKQYGLWSHSESPDGFVWKGKYDSTKVYCGSWTISIGIDSCNNVFFNEKYVSKLADLVFNEPRNKNIQTLKFELEQCRYAQGQRKLFYEITRDKKPVSELGKLLETKHAKIIKQLSEGYSGKPENKVVTLLVDALPTDPYSIASEFVGEHKQYRQVRLVVENINSQICKRVEFLFGFEK